MARADGAAIVEYLASHPTEAQELVEQTGLGLLTWADYSRARDEARRNPGIATELKRARATAQNILQRIGEKVALRRWHGERSSAPRSIEQAVADGDFEAYERIANQRDIERRRRGGL